MTIYPLSRVPTIALPCTMAPLVQEPPPEPQAVQFGRTFGEMPRQATNRQRHWCLVVEGIEYQEADRRWHSRRKKLAGTFSIPGAKILRPFTAFYQHTPATCCVVNLGSIVIENGVLEGVSDVKKLWAYEPEIADPWLLLETVQPPGHWTNVFIPLIEPRLEMIRRDCARMVAEAEALGKQIIAEQQGHDFRPGEITGEPPKLPLSTRIIVDGKRPRRRIEIPE